jgi:hypothetical protein
MMARQVSWGLMREDIQDRDKCPIWNIPLAGRLFRTTRPAYQTKSYHVCHSGLYDPAQPLIKVDEEKEIVPEPSAAGIE